VTGRFDKATLLLFMAPPPIKMDISGRKIKPQKYGSQQEKRKNKKNESLGKITIDRQSLGSDLYFLGR